MAGVSQQPISTEHCKTVVDESAVSELRSIVVAHAFVDGAATSESERPLMRAVGGIETVSAAAFDGAHYVALGHLHRPQSVGHDRSAVTAKVDADDATTRARELASAASAALADLRSREHEIEPLERKIDELGRHEQVLVDSAERHAEHEKAQNALSSAKQAQGQAASDRSTHHIALHDSRSSLSAVSSESQPASGAIDHAPASCLRMRLSRRQRRKL